MSSLREIRRRISSVKSTRQITKAMKMVSAAKLRRAQMRMTAARPYAGKMQEVLAGLVAGVDRDIHPLLAEREETRTARVYVITGDRGLCGSFNTNALKAGEKLLRRLRDEGLDVTVAAVGRKARSHFRKADFELAGDWEGLSGQVDYAAAGAIAKTAIEPFSEGSLDAVYLVYNEFRSPLIQEVVTRKLLPIETAPEEDPGDGHAEFLFEPSAAGILGRLLPKYVEVQFFQALLESQAAEEAARMNAMENATQAATDMIGSLTLQFNKARQAAITAELMDIIGGAEAVKQ